MKQLLLTLIFGMQIQSSAYGSGCDNSFLYNSEKGQEIQVLSERAATRHDITLFLQKTNNNLYREWLQLLENATFTEPKLKTFFGTYIAETDCGWDDYIIYGIYKEISFITPSGEQALIPYPEPSTFPFDIAKSCYEFYEDENIIYCTMPYE